MCVARRTVEVFVDFEAAGIGAPDGQQLQSLDCARAGCMVVVLSHGYQHQHQHQHQHQCQCERQHHICSGKLLYIQKVQQLGVQAEIPDNISDESVTPYSSQSP